ncbi:DUF4176 domain-containing protein [Streptococcus loxodontisalivarius]|uniref:DUF4176 domain-containing protein n=1 Tax=Streptococcus loxodontisalivarius TaxID=1349415 RepID=A0ABS2PUK4_9STRE|nr:DUF4176 domain-containing protein [Streptococcus loxodontisalivarius]MBM7643743.1 hypothetical protein [Streptococcus loxodontisalivarius]
MENELLPLGSVVYLKSGTVPVLIVMRQPVINVNGEIVYFDYAGVNQIIGLEPDKIAYFNKDNIREIIFSGYVSDKEPEVQRTLLNWRENNSEIPKGKL